MAGKSLGQRARLLLLLRLYLLEERSEGLRIVTGLVHVLQAQMVGLSLEAAREFHEAQLHAGLDLLGVLLADGDLFLYRIPIAQAAPTDVAVADGVHIVLAAVVLELVIGLLVGFLIRFLVGRRRLRGPRLGLRGGGLAR